METSVSAIILSDEAFSISLRVGAFIIMPFTAEIPAA
jgi:hypothetical protein